MQWHQRELVLNWIIEKQKMRNDVDNGKYESYYDFRQTKTNSNRSNKVRSKSINKLISFAFISTNL